MPLNSKYRIKKRISGKTENKNSTEKRGYNEFKSEWKTAWITERKIRDINKTDQWGGLW